MENRGRREVIPINERKQDWILWAFFLVNLTVVTYQADIEQLVIKDPGNFEYPIWPLPFVIDFMHWWSANFDPLLYARPTWYQMMVWVDQLFYGPFYAFALYAFWKGKEWIRNWCFIWAAAMLMTVIIILGEELMGPHATDHPLLIIVANAGWIIFPVWLMVRMWRDHPFTREMAE